MFEELKEYKKFLTSYYLTEGIRITSAIMIPVLIAGYFGQLAIGMAIALGVLCVSGPDSPGPLHHRKNAMKATILLIFVGTLITGFTTSIPWFIVPELLVLGFVSSMIGVYGMRASSVGMSFLLGIVLSIGDHFNAKEALINTGLVTLGGVWYYLWSLLLNRLRPYKMAQQVLGDSVLAIAEYLRIKASLYNGQTDYEKSYKLLLEQQVQVHNKQTLVREVLFKTRDIVQESTHVGRVLLMTFLDTVDLFERIMTSQYDYQKLHQTFGGDVLSRFEEVVLLLVKELDAIGVALQEGKKSFLNEDIEVKLHELEEFFVAYRRREMNETNIEGFLSLRHILESINDIYSRIKVLHRYTTYDRDLASDTDTNLDYNQFISHTEINPRILLDNLSFNSNVFRHSVRMSIALGAGYLLSLLLPFSHGYWILLTILVILKPAYSITKQRNIQRLNGTVIGAVIGVLILYLLKDKTSLIVIMTVCMVGAYSLMRRQYLLCVIFMTSYLLIAFHFLKQDHFEDIIRDRVMDTAVGSALAFIATLLIPPRWEHQQLRELLLNATRANAGYFEYIAKIFTNRREIDTTQYKYYRKEGFVAMSNLSDAFQRMLSEPRTKQKNSVPAYQLMVANHLLASHIATLSSYLFTFAKKYASKDFEPLIEATLSHLQDAQNILEGKDSGNEYANDIRHNKLAIHQRVHELMTLRVEELKAGTLERDNRRELSELKTIFDQFEYIHKISVDIEKISGEIV